MSSAAPNNLLSAFRHTDLIGVLREYETGLSGARVVAAELQARGPDGLNGVYVVKIGPREWASAERRRLKAIAASSLASMSPQFRGCSKIIDGQQAVAYDVAFDTLRRTTTLHSLLRQGGQSARTAATQISRLAAVLLRWNAGDSPVERFVVHPYDLLLRLLGPTRVGDLAQRLATYVPAWNQDLAWVSVDGLNRILPNPSAYLTRAAWSAVRSQWTCARGRVHGDLHSGNIICLPGGEVDPVVIDFSDYAADGVPFFDLAYLELDVLLQTLGTEREREREEWIWLLDCIMATTLPDQRPRGYMAERAWELVAPLRERVVSLQRLENRRHLDSFEICWWVATVAVGLNFARKGDGTRPVRERMASLLYAAFGLERLFACLDAPMRTGQSWLAAWVDCGTDWSSKRTTANPHSFNPDVAHDSTYAIGPEVPDGLTPEARLVRQRFCEHYAARLADAQRRSLAVLLWQPQPDVQCDVMTKRLEIQQHLQDKGHFAVLQEQVPEPVQTLTWDQRQRAQAESADLIIVLPDRGVSSCEQAASFCSQALGQASKLYGLFPSQYKDHASDAVTLLAEGYGAISWYGPDDIASCRVLSSALKRVEARRLVHAFLSDGVR